MMPIISKLARYGRIVGKRSEFTWRYVLNLKPTLAYALSAVSPTDEAARVLACLNGDGIAVTSSDALLGPGSCFPELAGAVTQRQIEMTDEIAAFGDGQSIDAQTAQKSYVFGLFPENRSPNPQDIYSRFALQDPILRIVNAYYGMYVSLHHCNVWHTFVTRDAPRQSQLWHRDPEDRHILKLFVHMDDVDHGSGPFVYARGSHPKRRLTRTPAGRHRDGNTLRSDDTQMAEVVPPDQWTTCVGPRGTIIFADTRGYHKGGLARERQRILYVCEFLSQAVGRGGISTRRPPSSGQAG